MKNYSNRLIILIVLSILVNSHLHAQQNLFKVLTFSGKVDYRISSNQPWEKVQTGENLIKDYEIKLEKNSYAALMFNDGRTLELLDEGIFKVGDLEQNMKSSKISITNKFINFVAQEIIADKSQKKDMKTFAAVVRVKPNYIDVALPTFTSLLQPPIDLIWYGYPSTNKYVLSILNSENTSIFMDLTNDTSFTLDTDRLNLIRGSVYKWYVVDAENPLISSDTNSVILLSEHEKIPILDTLQLLMAEAEANETALNAFSLGFFYEKYELNIEAMNQYRKALALAPESEEFKKLYAKFLLKQKLYIPASELLEDKLIN